MQTNNFEALGRGEATLSMKSVMCLMRSARDAGSGNCHGASQGNESAGCGHACPVERGSAALNAYRCRVSRNRDDGLNREQTTKISAERRGFRADDGFAERIAVNHASGGEQHGSRQYA